MSQKRLNDTAWIEEHNQDAAAVWEAFHAEEPTRPQVYLGTGTQFFIFNDDLNPGEAVSFEYYSTDAAMMLDFQLRSAVWRTENIAPFCNDPVGIPEMFDVKVDLQNYDEAAFLGAPHTPFANLDAMYQTARSLA